jgi:hypothetical protein
MMTARSSLSKFIRAEQRKYDRAMNRMLTRHAAHEFDEGNRHQAQQRQPRAGRAPHDADRQRADDADGGENHRQHQSAPQRGVTRAGRTIPGEQEAPRSIDAEQQNGPVVLVGHALDQQSGHGDDLQDEATSTRQRWLPDRSRTSDAEARAIIVQQAPGPRSLREGLLIPVAEKIAQSSSG